uniref:Histone-lysine N-methyltransferase, H3 lysine-36 and H4 lysine-20 specific-like n=1 Tax=Poecilia latipinna TaxID=48699 RepID=A0A3B3UUS1_9TELE
MSGPSKGPDRKSSCPLTPALDPCCISPAMSAAASSLKHTSVYGYIQSDHSSSSSSSSYSPLRRLQHLTKMVSRPDLVMPSRGPDRRWDWGSNQRDRTEDCWAEYREYSVSQEDVDVSSSSGEKQTELQSESKDFPAVCCHQSAVSEKMGGNSPSSPPSPAFSLDSSSPFANGLLHFDSALFEADGADEEPQSAAQGPGFLDKRDQPPTSLQLTPVDARLDPEESAVAPPKVVTRSQSSGQRRRYWDGSEDEWDSDSELFLFDDCPAWRTVQPSGSRKKPPPPVKFAEGEIVWAKFGRRPWWPCEVLSDPALGVYHRMKEPCDRLCRLYHVRTFGEPKEYVWVEEKSTQAFHGGFEFDQLLLLRRRSKQREQNNRNTIPKRFQHLWRCSVVEAESVLSGRPDVSPSLAPSTDQTFSCSSPAEGQKKPHPAVPSPSLLVPTVSEPLHLKNGSTSSAATAQTKPSTLKKTSTKKKRSKSLQDLGNENTLCCSLDQSHRDNRECPYSDLDSVPKILCPKALERQPKLLPCQPSAAAVKELKKQPDTQTGLWFSKSGRDRRPKTTSPVSDRSLFSKGPCKKKHLSTVSKKAPVPSASMININAWSNDPVILADSNKSTDNGPIHEHSVPEKCRASEANPVEGRGGSLDKPKAQLSTEDKQTSETKINPSSISSDDPDVEKDFHPSKKVGLNDDSDSPKTITFVSSTELSVVIATKQLDETEKPSDQEKERKQTLGPCLEVENRDPVSILEKQKNLVSKCRLPFVKLIRKELEQNKYLHSCLTNVTTNRSECNKKEKTSDSNVNKAATNKSDLTGSKTSVSTDQITPSKFIKVSVKKLRARSESGLLRLSSESPPEHNAKTPEHNNKTTEHNAKTPEHNNKTTEHNAKTPEHNNKTTEHNNKTTEHNAPTPGNNTKTPGNNASTPGNNTKTPEHNTPTPRNNAKTPGNNAKTPGNNTKTPGNSAKTPGNSAKTPGNNAKTPGNNAKTPGNNASTPGNNTKTPEHNTPTPGNITKKPGNNAKTPGNNAKTPGKNAKTPGNNALTSTKLSDALSSPEVERIPASNVSLESITALSCNESDRLECKDISVCSQTKTSSDQPDSSEENTSSTKTAASPTGSPHLPESRPSPKSRKAVHKLTQAKEIQKVLKEQLAHLPASSRLMTRALKALQVVDQRKRRKAQQETEQTKLSKPLDTVQDSAEPKFDICTNLKLLKSTHIDNGDCFSRCSSPSILFSDSDDFEADVKSEDEDLSVSSTPPMDFIPLTSIVKAKHEDLPPPTQPPSPQSPFSFMKAFKNVTEVSFQSLPNGSNGKPVSFRPDSKYQFSTFLMMLKDLHDTREREGAPLELEIGPPSGHVKEEPLMMPNKAPLEGHSHTCVLSKTDPIADKSVIGQSGCGKGQKLKRPCSRKSGSHWLKGKTNRRVSGPGFPGVKSTTGITSWPTADITSKILDVQIGSSWIQAGCSGDIGGQEEQQRWERLEGNQQVGVPLERRECLTLILEQPTSLGDDMMNKTDVILEAEEQDKTSAEHKRIRKPSKRLLEWTEEYNQIFSPKKKPKKSLQLFGKVKMMQSELCSVSIIKHWL